MAKGCKADSADYRALFLADTPFIDLRAPAEFAKGTFPTAMSLPLMTDKERAAVGTCYKQQGQQAAINLGHKLVQGDIKEARVRAWCDFAKANPDGFLYCWRGGLRSQISQQWMAEAGVLFPRVVGGYKALRRFLIDSLEALVASKQMLLLAGKTGCGKTLLLEQLPWSLDLEALANHNGSSFGLRLGGQPTQISFENALSIALLKLDSQGFESVLLEDESAHIGSLMLPNSLQQRMRQSPVILLETPLNERVEIIFDEYIRHRLAQHLGGEGGYEAFCLYLRNAFKRIHKRLGADAYQHISSLLEQALAAQPDSVLAGELHRAWITELLVRYYDPMYEYQLKKRPRACLFQGDKAQVLEFLANFTG
ncbi:tRNA 2-selenouridine(34) synthase MnmH [Aliiglaciecola sp. CAU 1673]|uniref:tRNA 2-selenouridine(34) synthase MnmH n=1 Tax=Aliiglaciecola sp. CAU 1673 TaxID=3032595 RepID=UPI0023DB14AB|nr:tRNA 2-selenouridine(34) synthase MnmH [Aliiglaciecola sp. CAU 1673]MDF2176666.1 tRNA 2-selenouridine(34) synthase MnmH [Aliiglaciecola sp. CAU 1673]